MGTQDTPVELADPVQSAEMLDYRTLAPPDPWRALVRGLAWLLLVFGTVNGLLGLAAAAMGIGYLRASFTQGEIVVLWSYLDFIIEGFWQAALAIGAVLVLRRRPAGLTLIVWTSILLILVRLAHAAATPVVYGQGGFNVATIGTFVVRGLSGLLLPVLLIFLASRPRLRAAVRDDAPVLLAAGVDGDRV